MSSSNSSGTSSPAKAVISRPSLPNRNAAGKEGMGPKADWPLRIRSSATRSGNGSWYSRAKGSSTSAPSRSIPTATIRNPRPPCRLCSFSKSASCPTQGKHQVARKVTRSTWPGSSGYAYGVDPTAESCSAGAKALNEGGGGAWAQAANQSVIAPAAQRRPRERLKATPPRTDLRVRSFPPGAGSSGKGRKAPSCAM